MGSKLLHPIPEWLARRNFGVYSDFGYYVSGEQFTTIANDGGTCAVSDGVGGVLTIDPDSVDSDSEDTLNDQAYIKSTTEIFKFAENKPLLFCTRAKLGGTTKASVGAMLGIKDAVADDDIVDTTGAIDSSFSGALFYHKKGENYWRCLSSIGSSQTDVLTDVSAVGGSWQDLQIEFLPLTSSLGRVTFKIDGVEVGLNSGVAHQIDFSSATEMQIGCGVKDLAENNGGYLKLDDCGCWQLR